MFLGANGITKDKDGVIVYDNYPVDKITLMERDMKTGKGVQGLL